LARLHRAQLAVAVYGIISMAVVDVAWDGDGEPWELAVLAIGYAIAIWFAHSFANVVAGGRDATWRDALAHEAPVMPGAAPVAVAALLGQAFGWSSSAVELAGLIGLGVVLVGIQLILLRTAPPHERRVGGTLVLDLVSALMIVLLLLAVH
jgi:hypothetical protein